MIDVKIIDGPMLMINYYKDNPVQISKELVKRGEVVFYKEGSFKSHYKIKFEDGRYIASFFTLPL